MGVTRGWLTQRAGLPSLIGGAACAHYELCVLPIMFCF